MNGQKVTLVIIYNSLAYQQKKKLYANRYVKIICGVKNNGYYVFDNSVLCCYYGDYNNILCRNKCRKEK